MGVPLGVVFFSTVGVALDLTGVKAGVLLAFFRPLPVVGVEGVEGLETFELLLGCLVGSLKIKVNHHL